MATELFVNGVFVPIKGGDKMTVTRLIADIAEPDKRSASFTKGFVCPGTPETNELFSHIFQFDIHLISGEENFSPTFNPNLRARAVVVDEGVPTFEGDLMLRKISLLRENRIEYVCEIYSSFRKLFNDIGEGLLSDLDLSFLDHAWTDANIKNSWAHTYANGFIYPMIDYGLHSDHSRWSIQEFRTAIFAKFIWDKIFETHNWAYDSDFLDTADFENLLLLGSGKFPLRNETTIDNETFVVGRTTSMNLIPQPLFTAYNTLDFFSFNTASGTILGNTLTNTNDTEFIFSGVARYVPDGDKGLMRFRMAWTAHLNFNGSGPTSVEETVKTRFYLVATGPSRLSTGTLLDYWDEEYVLSAGSNTGADTASVETNRTTLEVEIFDDDEISIRLGAIKSDQFSGTTPQTRFDVVIEANSLFGNIPQQELLYSEMVTPSDILPAEMKQRDFIMGIVKLYNLYIDDSSERRVLIEPRNDGYYLTGEANTRDFTDKLAISEPYGIIPMGSLQASRYVFKHKEGKDYLSQKHLFQFGMGYGEIFYNVDNDFLTKTKTIEVPFASAPLANDANKNDRAITSLHFVSDSGTVSEVKDEVRLVYWGGQIDTLNDWKYVNNDGSETNQTSYPYAGHLDDPTDPLKDYMFGTPKSIYYDIRIGSRQFTTYSTDNLFNRFYSKFIREITDINSKILEGWFYLDTATWLDLSFRNLYFIKDSYWRLLEVRDYDITGKSLTFCRFLKTDFVQGFEGVVGRLDPKDKEVTLPDVDVEGKTKQGTTRPGLSTNDGVNNGVYAPKATIKGDGNLVTEGATGTTMLNSNNNVAAAEGVTLINTDDRIVDRENDVWINDINYQQKISITMDNGVVNTLHTTPIEILEAPSADMYWEIDRVEFFLDYNGVDYTGGGKLQIETSGNTVLYQDGVAMASHGGADFYGYLDDQRTSDLTSRMGDSLQVSSDAEIASAGGEVTVNIYYRLMEF